jgi:hypothetical protein
LLPPLMLEAVLFLDDARLELPVPLPFVRIFLPALDPFPLI